MLNKHHPVAAVVASDDVGCRQFSNGFNVLLHQMAANSVSVAVAWVLAATV